MCVTVADPMNVVTKVESLNAINSVHQLDNCSFEVATVNNYCVINDTASDDRAERASIADYCLYNGRRPFLVFQANKTNKPCKYIYLY